MDDEFVREFHSFLDSNRENKLYVSFSYSEDFSFVKEFVLIFLTKVGGIFSRSC
jgi:hypothetical protein